MFLFLQMLCVVFLLAGLCAFFHSKRKTKKTIAMLCGLMLVSAYVGNMMLSWIPMATEQITLTATGETSGIAMNNEVVLIGVISDGKTYAINNATEGKWFWRGSQYMWRDEGDIRQPEGTTRNITLNIPIGAGRSLVFNGNPYSGMVQITFKNETNTYDLYNETFQDIPISIPDTNPVFDNAVKIGRLALFVVFILLLMAYPTFAVIYFSEDIVWKWFERYWDRLIYILLAICSFAIMFYNGQKGSFWHDEVWTLGWLYGGFPGKTSIVYQWLNSVWFSLMPYGEEYLLILSELLVAAAIYVLGTLGNMYKGKQFGVILATLGATSFPVINQCGSEFRPYALLFFCISALLYLFIRKQREHGEKISTVLLYGAVLTLAMDTHDFGFILAGLLMISDVVLIMFKRNKKTVLIGFALPSIYAVYSLLARFTSTLAIAKAYSWPEAPSLRGVVSCLKWLCSDSFFLFAILLIGIVSTIVHLVVCFRRKAVDFCEDSIFVTFLVVPTMIFVLTFLYPVVFPGASVFVDRYFVVILPFCLFFMSIGIENIVENLSINFSGSKNIGLITWTVSCVLILCIFSWHTVSPTNIYENHKGTAEYLMAQDDIYNSSTLCFVVGGNVFVNDGFEYYFTQKGKRDSINHSAYLSASDLTVYKTIYCVYHHASFNPTQFLENGYVEVYSNDSLALRKYVKSDS